MHHKQEYPTWLDKTLKAGKYKLKLHSVTDFNRIFHSEDACLQYLLNLKHGDYGWRCRKCQRRSYSFLTTRKLIKCKNCGYEESFIANTVMHRSRKPLVDWFWCIYTISTGKGIAATELKKQLGFGSYRTAWTWLHKLRMVMIEPHRTPLKGTCEIDESYLYASKSGKGRKMKAQRHKALVVCAVEVSGLGSGRVRFRSIPSAGAKSLESFIFKHINRGTTIVTDGWTGYKGLNSKGYHHIAKPIYDPKEASKIFPRVHRMFANLKFWLLGTHRWVSKRHLQNYLNEFAFRMNFRSSPISGFNYVLMNAVLNKPRTYRGFTFGKKPRYVNPELELPNYIKKYL